MRRIALICVLAAAVLPALTAALALALPQQHGRVDLLHQADGQWEGPGEAQGGSATGSSVVGLGDIFHDGRDAFAIGAPEADPGARQSAGSVYIVAGQPGTSAVDLTALIGRGYRIDGANAGDELGFSLAALTLPGGDPGLVIGAPYANPYGRSQAGVIYVVDLRKLHGNIDLSVPSRAVVGVIDGPAACAQSGYALAAFAAGRGAGGKGEALLDGAPGVGPGGCPNARSGGVPDGNTGAAFVIFNVRRHLDLAVPGSDASTFNGLAPGDRTGSAVAAAGTPGSFLIGAPDASPLGRAGAGAVYLLHGAPAGQTVSLASPPAGSTTFAGAAAGDELGFSLAATSGFASSQRPDATDLALGAPGASPAGLTQAGSVFVVPATHQPATVDLASGAAGGGTIDGGDAGDQAGYSLAGLGDLNGNGRDDLAIGAPFLNSPAGGGRIDAGAVYLLYGGTGSFDLDLAALHHRGFVAVGARESDEAGTAVAGMTDETGDGLPDLLIGAPFAENTFGSSPTAGGAVYAVRGFGSRRR
jgi:FG-GAP repeat